MGIYKIAIYAVIILGIAHSLMTYKKYKEDEKNAFWFLSAGIALIFSGIINLMYINSLNNNYTLVLISNIILVIFSVALAINQKKMTMIAVAIVSLVLTCSFYFLK